MSTQDTPLLKVEDLGIDFVGRKGKTRAVSDISLCLKAGEVLCLIGESGSGKSLTLRALMGLLSPRNTQTEGTVSLAGQNIQGLSEKQLARIRGAEIAMVFQEPMTALDPVYTIGHQIVEAIRQHEKISKKDAEARALELLQLVRIPSPERRLQAYPMELSGGLRQRAMIAVALAAQPRVLLADEPTTALDATVQIQVLILLKKLQTELGMGVIFVTHDLGVAAQISDQVAVMYAGRIVEHGAARDVLRNPGHPYTQGLINSTVNGQPRDRDIAAIPGSPPDLRQLPDGCSFAPRCPHAQDICRIGNITLEPAPGGTRTRCLRAGEIAQTLSLKTTKTTEHAQV